MKKILSYLKQYVREELKMSYLLCVMLFMALYVFVEYRYDFMSLFGVNYNSGPPYVGVQCLIFFFPFLFAYYLYSVFHRNFDNWKKPLFWFLLLFAPFVFGLRSLVYVFSDDLYSLLPAGRTAFFYYRCTAVLMRDVLILLPVLVYWWFADKKHMPFYGFTLKNYDTRPYLILLGLMVPLVVLASYQGDFLHQYPKGFSLEPLSMDNSDEQKYFFIYELFYGFDFIFIEFFFRGFLLLAFYRHFGWSCLLPMACFYVSIHFGKPLGETISSFFGGSILGILAIRTGSIAGGIIVHLGVAWLMEFTALLHKIL